MLTTKSKLIADKILAELRKERNQKNIEAMSRFGIRFDEAYGVKRDTLQRVVKPYMNNVELAEELRTINIHEAQLAATLVDDPKTMTPEKMDAIVDGFYSWDVCDSACSKLFKKCDFLNNQIFKYAKSDKEFVKRAAFTLIVVKSVHQKTVDDREFLPYLELIESTTDDSRNYVIKAVEWSLRAIGKRTPYLNEKAIETAERLAAKDDKNSRWIGLTSLRELRCVKRYTNR